MSMLYTPRSGILIVTLRLIPLFLLLGNIVSCPAAHADDTRPVGMINWHINKDALVPLGLKISVDGRSLRSSPADSPYDSTQCGLRYVTEASSTLNVPCTVHFESSVSSIALNGLRLIQDPNDVTKASLRGQDDAVWFWLDHAHADAVGLPARGYHADLRIGQGLAVWLRQKDASGVVIGGMDWQASTESSVPKPQKSSGLACDAPLASPGNPAMIKLIAMTSNFDTHVPDSITFERCTESDFEGHLRPCSNQSTSGQVVFAPDASLENVGKSGVPWYGMFSGRFPPYDNDQHPFLIWNLYRVDENGVIRQIGKSGVKHAFYAINVRCNCPGGHVVFPTCQDTYSSYNNDSLEFLGPREEIIPALGIWGSCGSVFDSDCDGNPGPRPPGQDDGHRWRMNVSESDLLPEKNHPARYYFEYGYIIRDSNNAKQSFGFREVHPQKLAGSNGFGAWALNPSILKSGFFIDDWVGSRGNLVKTLNESFETAAGTGQIAVRVTKVNGATYRFTYAIHNIDLASTRTRAEGTGIRIETAHGIDRIRMLNIDPSKLQDVHLYTTNVDSGWLYRTQKNRVTWETTLQTSELSWGTIYVITFQSNRSPQLGELRVHIGDSSDQAEATVRTLIPAN